MSETMIAKLAELAASVVAGEITLDEATMKADELSRVAKAYGATLNTPTKIDVLV